MYAPQPTDFVKKRVKMICSADDTCQESATAVCPVCDTPVCDRHMSAIPFSMADVCTACAVVLRAADARYAV